MSDAEKHIALKYMGYKNPSFITLNETNYDPLLPYIAGVDFVCLESVSQLDADYNENSNKAQDMKCFICQKVVGTTWLGLLQHCAKEHFNETIKCTKCSSQFANAKELDKHMDEHNVSSHTVFVCAYCDGKFRTNRFLDVHEMNCKNPQKPDMRVFQCSKCSSHFGSAQESEKHMDEHNYSSHTVFVCAYCDGKFRTNRFLDLHEINCKVLKNTVITRTNQGLPLETPNFDGETGNTDPKATSSPNNQYTGNVQSREAPMASSQDTSKNEPRGAPKLVSGIVNKSSDNQASMDNKPKPTPTQGHEISGMTNRFQGTENQNTKKPDPKPMPATKGNTPGFAAQHVKSNPRPSPIKTPRSNNFTISGGGAARNLPSAGSRNKGGIVSAHVQRIESGGPVNNRPNTTQNIPGRTKVMKKVDYFESNPISHQASGAKPQPGYSRNPGKGNANRNAYLDEKWWNDIENLEEIGTYQSCDDGCIPKSNSFNVYDANFGIDNFNEHNFPLQGGTTGEEALVSFSDPNISYNVPPTHYNQYSNNLRQYSSFDSQASSRSQEPIQVVTSRGVSYQDCSDCGVPRYISDSYGNNGENAVHISFSSGGYDYDIEVYSEASINVTTT